jgi:hypothetical protein
MGEIVTNPPSTPNTVSDSWQPLLDVNTMSYYGLNRVTLTNWDSSTTIPEVAQGSAIDIDGSVARFTTDEAIGGSPADGVVYLKFVVSGAVVTPELTATAPTWYADKAGWYNVSGERYSGHRLEKTGTSYKYKSKILDNQTGLVSPPNMGVGLAGEYFFKALSPPTDYWVPEAGVYIVVVNSPSPAVYNLEINTLDDGSGGWQTSNSPYGGGVIFTNGSTVRIKYTSTTISGLRYRRIW